MAFGRQLDVRTAPLGTRRPGWRASAALAFTLALASPALAQQVTVFSQDFEGYTAGQNLPTGGATDSFASRTSGGSKETVESGSASQFLYMRGGGGIQVTSRVINAGGVSATLTFDLRYTGNNGDATTDNLTDGSFTFNEFDSTADDLLLEYTINGTTFSTLQSFAYNDTTYRSGFATVTVSLPSTALVSTLQLRLSQPSGGGGSADQWAVDNVALAVVTPEPAAALSFAVGGIGLAFTAWRRRKSDAQRRPASAPLARS